MVDGAVVDVVGDFLFTAAFDEFVESEVVVEGAHDLCVELFVEVVFALEFSWFFVFEFG